MDDDLINEGSSSSGVTKGAWTKAEDDLLEACIKQYGEGNWHLVPQRAGLNRCRKSCRLRWLNYLRPDIKRGEFNNDEVDLIIRMHKLLGNRWTLIAGRLPGRTANNVKNYWHTYMRNHKKKKKIKLEGMENMKPHEVIKPLPRTFTKSYLCLQRRYVAPNHSSSNIGTSHQVGASSSTDWWENLLDVKEDNEDSNYTCSLSGGVDLERILVTNHSNQEFNSSITVEDCDFIGQDQTWNNVLLDVNLWDTQIENHGD